MIHGITITLIDKVEVGKDPFDRPVYEDKEIEVENVLVGLPTADDINSSLDLHGKKAIYTLGIPKGDTHDWEDKEVRFFGQRFKTFGFVIQGIESNIPLSWNKQIKVERYE